jgi:Right handed beta helix region
MKRLLVVLILVVVAAGLYVGPAQAGSDWRGARKVRVVDDDLHHGKCQFGHARYHSIQQAVNVSGDGDVILVCPGTYFETVEVDKRLTIKGAKAGQDARWRDQTKESVITPPDGEEGDSGGLVRLRSDGITWDGFLIENNLLGPGMFTSEEHSGYRIRNTIFFENGIGLNLASDGERVVEVLNNRFTRNNEFATPDIEQPGAGSGIYSDRGAACVLIADNLFEFHNGGGILFADNGGDPRQERVRVVGNTSVDDNSFATFYTSTDVQIVANTVRSEAIFDDPASAIFVGAGNRDILVKYNRIKSANGNGIDVRDSGARPDNSVVPPENVDVLKNKVAGAKQHGIDIAATGTEQYEVRGNLAVRNTKVGIHVGAPPPGVGPTGASLTRNTALDNGAFDCQDETQGGGGTGGIRNAWEDNVGGLEPNRDQPDGICGPPPLNHDDDHHHGKHKHHKKRHHKKHPKYDEWCECLRTGRY